MDLYSSNYCYYALYFSNLFWYKIFKFQISYSLK